MHLCFESLAHSELIVPMSPTADTIKRVSHPLKRSDFLKPLECYSDMKRRNFFLVHLSFLKSFCLNVSWIFFSLKSTMLLLSGQCNSVIFPKMCNMIWLKLILHKCVWFAPAFYSFFILYVANHSIHIKIVTFSTDTG